MVHTRRNTDVPLTIPDFLARVTPPRQPLTGRPSVASTIPFPSDSPLSSISSSSTAQYRSFSYDMAGSNNPDNSGSSGSHNPAVESTSDNVANDKGKATEEQNHPVFNPGTEDFKNLQGDMLRMIFEKFIAQGPSKSLR
ncbi:hypothetical protein PGT21_022231 [Puccinia graminis f. sp. tritici]|uniref:Uncharacterized protein n=1 Tax=Puccinia graminis f. sp. tritici TaxID=56615 RepID=A0A5B0PY78_PUCGR|nr:hypothetical protein PGT21_022231 [Puccinia graminis f. sp. tritici]KAA1131658.1 hypothetical protein PGTUg99_034826 [Puccinia graminis f. sp. tritici]